MKVFIVAELGATLSARIRNHCGERFAVYKLPKDVELLDSLPKSSVRKILRRKLRQLC